MRRFGSGVIVALLTASAALVGTVAPAPAGATTMAPDRQPGPLRVLLVGDSMTFNYEAAAKPLLAAEGYQVTLMGIAGSSLLDHGVCDGVFAKGLLKSYRPDIVVYEANGNYANRVNAGVPVCQPAKPYGSAAWLRRWRNSAALSQRILTRRGAAFLWIEPPSVNSEPKADVLPELNAIYRGLGPTVDAWTAFGGPTFDQSLRYDDQHLNQQGAAKLAHLVVTAIGPPQAYFPPAP
jgi:hypothetical protein